MVVAGGGGEIGTYVGLSHLLSSRSISAYALLLHITGQRYLVVDAGAGTVDLTLYRVSHSSSSTAAASHLSRCASSTGSSASTTAVAGTVLSEEVAARGEMAGSVYVDQAFK